MKCVAIFSMLALSTMPHVAYSQTVYNVVPRDLDDGYRIAGGTITADESLASITAWNIQVAGDLPYTFSDTNPGASVEDLAVDITPSRITFSPSSIHNPSARFAAFDNTSTECMDCVQSLIWTQLDPAGVSFLVYVQDDRLDSNPSLSPDALFLDGDVLVATAVPEPSGFMLLLMGLLLSGIRSPRAYVFDADFKVCRAFREPFPMPYLTTFCMPASIRKIGCRIGKLHLGPTDVGAKGNLRQLDHERLHRKVLDCYATA